MLRYGNGSAGAMYEAHVATLLSNAFVPIDSRSATTRSPENGGSLIMPQWQLGVARCLIRHDSRQGAVDSLALQGQD